MTAASIKFAFRNLLQGLSGFRIFLACIALGVTAIVGVDSLARALTDGLASEGRTLLGADIVVSRMHRPADASERALINSKGRTTEIISLRGMARTTKAAALVDLKVVDQTYPLLAPPVFDPALPLASITDEKDGIFGVAADAALFARLGVKTGDKVALGDATVELRAVLVNEPDRIGAGLTLGPRVILSRAAFEKTGLLKPESLIRFSYRLLLDDPRDDRLAEIDAALTPALSEAGFELRGRKNVSPQLTRNIERFSQYLGLIGLTALIIGGLGVANAVIAYLDRRRKTMAIFKAIGASGSTIFQIAFLEIMALAALGTGIGLILGASLPYLVSLLASTLLPFPIAPNLYPDRLALGALYGILTAATFALPILGRAHDLPVAILFRDDLANDQAKIKRRYQVMTAMVGLALVGIVILAAREKLITVFVLLGMAAAFFLLRGVAFLIMRWARQAPHPQRTELRLALGNIYRRGTITPALTLALGLGVTLLVAISATQNNLVQLVSSGLPDKAPSFFFVDIPARDLPAFDEFMKLKQPETRVSHVPMVRGRITEVKSIRAEAVVAEENARWVLDGDRGITFSSTVPEGSRIVSGEWWSETYDGPPLVSLEADIAKGLNLTIGDMITVNILGRSIQAKIANLRRVDWQSLGINFVLVFSPNTFKGAPVSYLATLTDESGSQNVEREAQLLVDTAQAFPAVSAIRVREALESVRTMIDQLAVAIRGVAGITILASILVLAGAVGASQRRRIRDAVILKTLGASRFRLLTAFLAEFAMISLAASFFGLIAGLFAAWAIVAFAFRTAFTWPMGDPFATAALAVVFAIGLGLIGTWRVLDEKPARHLRAP
ncbi:MAG: hypothetical protein RLZ07_601 [Pseudomonadota bacterium]|jgi:putative ABC transport system permease protein